MPAPVYATPADLAAWLGTPAVADNAVRALRTAASQVREATELWRYTADTVTGLPTDTTIATALTAATCIQAAAIIAADLDPDAGGVPDTAVEASTGIGSARITFAGAEQAAQARAALAHHLCPDARRELQQALQNSLVWIAG